MIRYAFCVVKDTDKLGVAVNFLIMEKKEKADGFCTEEKWRAAT